MKKLFILMALAGLVAPVAWTPTIAAPQQAARRGEEVLVSEAEAGRFGGRLVVALRSEPKTLNPVLAADNPTRDVLGRMMADLIHINRYTQRTEPALAKSWTVSPDGQRYTLHLRRGLRFSDGHPMDADDVVFTFQVNLDEKVGSPQRDLLLVRGKPIQVRKVSSHTVVFDIPEPYAAAERLFDSIAILPSHLLLKPYQEGKMGQSWGLGTPPEQIAGLGPFRLKEYVPGQRIVLARNPYYWKVNRKKERLPYLDEIVFLFAPSEDAQVIRFQAGETDVVSRISARNYAVLARDSRATGYRLLDLGPGLEYNFLAFNLNDLTAKSLPGIAQKQAWFRDVRFRQAIAAGIDREGILRLVYDGRATALWTQVTPGNKRWVSASLARPARSVEKARELLRAAGFSWRSDGTLVDAQGTPVTFSIVTSASNAARVQMATIIQEDLKELGMAVQVSPIEFRSLLDRVFNTLSYEAVLSGLVSGDADPTSEMNVWALGGATHLWNLSGRPLGDWETEMDQLMQQQMVTLDYPKRKRQYDRVQSLVAEYLPVICLVSPNVLVGVKNDVGNFQPAILEPTTLWNADEIFRMAAQAGARQ